MTEEELRLDRNTVDAARDGLETKLNRMTDPKEVEESKQDYLELERRIVRANFKKQLDQDCAGTPPWKRAENQIVRDLDDVETYTSDEIGLMRRFIAEVDGWVKLNDINESWYIWNGTHWTDVDAKHNVKITSQNLKAQMAYEKPARMNLEIKRVHNRDIPGIKLDPEWVGLVKAAGQLPVLNRIVEGAQSYLHASLNQDRRIPFLNGMFDPETGILTSGHRPEDLNTACSPYELKLEVPAFEPGETFFKQISCGDDEWTKAVFRILGDSLVFGNKHQAFYIFYGPGKNGKSVLIDWIQAALGSLTGNVKASEISKVNKSNFQTTLFDTVDRCRIIFIKESGGIQYDDEIVKGLTGEKSMPFTRIYAGAKDLEVCATPILITNSLPTVDEGGISMMRRQIGIPFDYQVPDGEEDENLLSKLATKEGNEWLISKMVNALIEGQKPDAPSFRDSLPERINRSTQEVLYEADIVLQFLDECCCRDEEFKRYRTSRHELYLAFLKFAYDPVDGRAPTSSDKFKLQEKSFGKKLRSHGLIPLDGKQRTSSEKGTLSGQPRSYVYPGIVLREVYFDSHGKRVVW